MKLVLVFSVSLVTLVESAFLLHFQGFQNTHQRLQMRHCRLIPQTLLSCSLWVSEQDKSLWDAMWIKGQQSGMNSPCENYQVPEDVACSKSIKLKNVPVSWENNFIINLQRERIRFYCVTQFISFFCICIYSNLKCTFIQVFKQWVSQGRTQCSFHYIILLWWWTKPASKGRLGGPVG